ncbi:MAG: hypothetical protein FI717_10105 [SAR202 cluster bacterium]|nr:hypothetical protein [Chloroflexota bacterium]MQF95891.1 hypothetical protein [SAR202 cluster bacterium]MQG34641.1 hypothetical protein [SAR202 cluster bacterium]HAA95556.1 hypothetical protein [Dehalococcoidia bacterium]HCP23769.1 hypothetical protein [Dehalococcoidia bacterium]|tara:strand:+ start:579 stop:1391 length:813 start_codon:yes stop_codon:yes gene_type:complete
MTHDNNKLSVLCLFAHPDDEAFGSGGTIAELVQNGHRVTMVCATNGDVGEISDPTLATPENLWQVRQGELCSAMDVIGVADVRFLNYRDSGMPGTPDNENPASLFQSDPAKVEAQVKDLIDELRPDLLFTHDPTGGYGHPDHVTVHERVTATVESMDGDRPHLYYVCFPQKNFRTLWQDMTDNGITPPFAKEMLDEIGSPDDYVTTVRDLGDYVKIKKESLRCHQTQLDPNGPFGQMAPEWINNWMSTEYFYLKQPDNGPAQEDILASLF